MTRRLSATYRQSKKAPISSGNIKKKSPDRKSITLEGIHSPDALTIKRNVESPTHLYDEDENEEVLDDAEETLRQWDMDMTYGPCIGMTRLQRWYRALKLEQDPPAHIKDLLIHAGANPNCLWEGRV